MPSMRSISINTGKKTYIHTFIIIYIYVGEIYMLIYAFHIHRKHIYMKYMKSREKETVIWVFLLKTSV